MAPNTKAFINNKRTFYKLKMYIFFTSEAEKAECALSTSEPNVACA